jgi:hypothetical protein
MVVLLTKSEESIVYFAQNGQPEIKTLASDALARMRHVERLPKQRQQIHQ